MIQTILSVGTKSIQVRGKIRCKIRLIGKTRTKVFGKIDVCTAITGGIVPVGCAGAIISLAVSIESKIRIVLLLVILIEILIIVLIVIGVLLVACLTTAKLAWVEILRGAVVTVLLLCRVGRFDGWLLSTAKIGCHHQRCKV